MFGGVVPKEIVLPSPAHTVADVQSQDVRDLEISPDQYAARSGSGDSHGAGVRSGAGNRVNA